MSDYTDEDAERDSQPQPEHIAKKLRALREGGIAQAMFNYEQEADGADAWDIRPLSDVEEQDEPPPSLCEFAPGDFAFFPGQINWLYGDNDSAKTWLALWTAKEAIESGHAVLIYELEMAPGKIKSRLRTLGADKAAIERLAVVVRPASATTDQVRTRVQAAFHKIGPPFVIIIDSAAASLSLSGFDSNAAGDVGAWAQEELSWFFDYWPQAAVLVIDHTPHSAKHATGSKRKGDVADATFLVEMRERITRAKTGYTVVTCEKDRGGYHPYDRALFALEGGGGGPWSARRLKSSDKTKGKPNASDPRQQAIDAFRNLPPEFTVSFTDLRNQIGGKSTAKRSLVDDLVQEEVLKIVEKQRYSRGPKYPI